MNLFKKKEELKFSAGAGFELPPMPDLPEINELDSSISNNNENSLDADFEKSFGNIASSKNTSSEMSYGSIKNQQPPLPQNMSSLPASQVLKPLPFPSEDNPSTDLDSNDIPSFNDDFTDKMESDDSMDLDYDKLYEDTINETKTLYPDVAKFELPDINLDDLDLKFDNFDDRNFNTEEKLMKEDSSYSESKSDLGKLSSLPKNSYDKSNNYLFVKMSVMRDFLEIWDVAKKELDEISEIGNTVIKIAETEEKDINKFKSVLCNLNEKLYRAEDILFGRI